MPNKPNILWICTDQQRFDTLGCYGNPYVHTPNLDRLAEQSILFEYAFSQSPVCTPSRSSFLTGRYPRTTRCRQNGQSIPGDENPRHQNCFTMPDTYAVYLANSTSRPATPVRVTAQNAA